MTVPQNFSQPSVNLAKAANKTADESTVAGSQIGPAIAGVNVRNAGKGVRRTSEKFDEKWVKFQTHPRPRVRRSCDASLGLIGRASFFIFQPCSG
jgi:hypothetical protein